MANSTVFNSRPQPDTVNEAGGAAYSMDPKHAIAQYAVTGCFNNTFYATGKDQLEKIKELINQLPKNSETAKFLCRLAVYARHSAFMKDMPAFLMAYVCSMQIPDVESKKVYLATLPEFKAVVRPTFHRVIDNGKMLRNFIQIMRSGVCGRKSLGSFPKKLVKEWIDKRDDATLFRNSIGNAPSFADIIKMVHPKARTSAIQKYLLGQTLGHDEIAGLPENIIHYEAFKQYLQLDEEQKRDFIAEPMKLPDVGFEFLTSLPLTEDYWKQLAKQVTWQQARINLNAFEKHKVFEDETIVNELAEKLRKPEAIKKAKAMPYQLLAAFRETDSIPTALKDALNDALNTSLENAPKLAGKTHVFVDSSGSMNSSATGGYNSKISCLDVASLFAAGLLKANPDAKVYSCDTTVYPVKAYHKDSLPTIQQTISKANTANGGTNLGATLQYLYENCIEADNVVIVSDCQSWYHGGKNPQDWLNMLWTKFPKCKIVCIDIQPNGSMQFAYNPKVLHVGGFNDSVFAVAEGFFSNQTSFVDTIEGVTL